VKTANSRMTEPMYMAFQYVLRMLTQGAGIVSLFSHAKAWPLMSGISE